MIDKIEVRLFFAFFGKAPFRLPGQVWEIGVCAVRKINFRYVSPAAFVKKLAVHLFPADQKNVVRGILLQLPI